MAFRFRLDRILALRGQLRRQAEDALADARAAVDRIDESIAAARAAQAEARRAEEAGVEFSGADLQRWRRYAEVEREREARLCAQRLEAERVVAERLASLLARRRDERALERLRERARERYDAAESIAQGRLLDELALRGRQEKER